MTSGGDITAGLTQGRRRRLFVGAGAALAVIAIVAGLLVGEAFVAVFGVVIASLMIRIGLPLSRVPGETLGERVEELRREMGAEYDFRGRKRAQRCR